MSFREIEGRDVHGRSISLIKTLWFFGLCLLCLLWLGGDGDSLCCEQHMGAIFINYKWAVWLLEINWVFKEFGGI
jgi:hypothetical protein